MPLNGAYRPDKTEVKTIDWNMPHTVIPHIYSNDLHMTSEKGYQHTLKRGNVISSCKHF